MAHAEKAKAMIVRSRRRHYGGGGGTINGAGGSGNVSGGGRGNAGGGGKGNTGKGEQSRSNTSAGTQQKSWAGESGSTSYGAPTHTNKYGVTVARSPETWSALNDQVGAYNQAADRWNRGAGRSFGNFVNRSQPFGFSMEAPDFARPATYVGGDYHLGVNPAKFVGSLLGPWGSSLVLGPAAGKIYTELGGQDVMLGGGDVPDTWHDWHGTGLGTPGSQAPGPTSPTSPSGASPQSNPHPGESQQPVTYPNAQGAPMPLPGPTGPANGGPTLPGAGVPPVAVPTPFVNPPVNIPTYGGLQFSPTPFSGVDYPIFTPEQFSTHLQSGGTADAKKTWDDYADVPPSQQPKYQTITEDDLDPATIPNAPTDGPWNDYAAVPSGSPVAAGDGTDGPWNDYQTITEADLAEPAQQGSGILPNWNAGINSTAASVLGLPMDIGVHANQVAIDAGQWLKRKVTGESDKTLTDLVTGKEPERKQVYVPDWIPTSDNIERWMGDTGFSMMDNTVAVTPSEKMARGAGDAVGTMAEIALGGRALLQSGIEEAYPVLGKIVRQLTESVMPSASGAGGTAATTAKNLIAYGAVPGAAGAAAEELAPEEYKPLANFGGQLVAGGAAAGAEAALGAGANLFKSAKNVAIGPMTSAGRRQKAGRDLRNAATDPGMLGANIEPIELVPGSQPTMGQASGDPGIMQLERTIAQKNPGEYAARLGGQNSARVAALRNLAPETAQPSAASDFFKQTLADIDQSTAQAELNARLRLQAAETLHGQNTATAQGQATAAMDSLGGTGPAQQIGATIRQQLADQEARAKAATSRLWQAVDPSGTATLDISPLKSASFQIRSSMPKVAKPIEGEERAIFDAVDGLPQVAAFGELQALDSRIAAEIRAERAKPGANQMALRRLQQLKDGVRSTMSASIERLAQQDAEGVRAGTMAPADSIFARFQGLASEVPNAGVERQAVARDMGAGPASGGAAGSGTAAPSGAAAPAPGTPVQGAGLAGGPQGTPGVSAPTADEGLAPRYRAAKAATLDQKQKFNQGPIGQVLRPGAQGAPFATMDSAVGDKLFVPGPKGGETIAAFQRAGGDLRQLQDYIGFSLRQAAVRNGELDPVAFERWAARYRPALEGLPEEITAPFFRANTAQQNAGAAAATRTQAVREAQAFLDDQAAARSAALKEYQTGAARAFLKDQDPVQAVAQTITRPDDFRALARSVSGDADAKAGLQRATVDYILQRFQGSQLGVGTEDEILKGGQLDQFFRKNRGTLAALFTPEQIQVLDNVVADIQRQNLVTSSSKLPVGSNTPQDLANAGKYGNKTTVLDHLIREAGGAGLGAAAAGPAGAVAGGFLARMASKFRAAGLNRVDELLTQAVLDPAFGQLLLSEVGPKGPTPLLINMLAGRLTATTAAAFEAKRGK